MIQLVIDCPSFQLFDDNDLWFPTQLIARYRLRAGNKAPTFIYRFDANTDYVNRTGTGLELYRYPSHGHDMQHVFKSSSHKPLNEVTQETKNTVDLMVTTFTNFAASGSPSASELGIFWPPVASEDELLMGLNIHETGARAELLSVSKRMKVFTEIWDGERP
jgi:carboxylesterase type B